MPAHPASFPAPHDRLARPLRDLRVSLTDRCNFRCQHCLPRGAEPIRFLPRGEILTFEEIARVVRIARGLGVAKVRLTGGEPLLRANLSQLVAMLAEIEGLEVALTTNGSLLAAQAAALAAAGLARLNVSLDSLDDATFRRMNDVDLPVARVLAGLVAAERAGFRSLRLNCVVRRGANERQLVDLAARFRGTAHVVRFIEYMEVGGAAGWSRGEVVPAAEIVATIDAAFPLEPIAAPRFAGVAERWRYRDGGGEIGVIAAVTRPFCGDCTRLRLSAEGGLVTCLFAPAARDLRAPLRSGASDLAIAELLRGTWQGRADRYSERRARGEVDAPAAARLPMSHLGG